LVTVYIVNRIKTYDMKKIYVVAIGIIGSLFCGQPVMAQFNNDDKITIEDPTPTTAEAENAKGGSSKTYKRRSINDGDFVWGASYSPFTDSLHSPYKKSIDVYVMRELLLADERLQLQVLSQIGYMSEGRKEWFAHALHSSRSNVMEVPGAFRVGLNASLTAILLNRHLLGISVGPTAGLMLGTMPKLTMSTITTKYTPPFLLSPTLGVRANIYLGGFIYLGASYTSTIG
jgi:hypothetical protein